MFLISPIKSSTSRHYNKLITLIISISKVIPSYSYYIKKGLVYIARHAHNQRNRNQPIDFDYYIITAPDYD